MLKRRFLVSKDRAGKTRKTSKLSFHDDCKQRLRGHLTSQAAGITPETSPSPGCDSPALNSAIVTVVVGRDLRLFAAHEEVLARSPWLAELCAGQAFSSPEQRQITLPDEVPEVFSLVLQYLYGGDYRPRLVLDPDRREWVLDKTYPTMSPRSDVDTSPLPPHKKSVGPNELATMYHSGVGDYIFRDTAVFCAALRLDMPDLQRLALRKQRLQTHSDVATVMRSARFAYANTSQSDFRLRAYYLTLIVRNRKAFTLSGPMQMEMDLGGSPLFFDLFVTLCHHIDDLSEIGSGRSSAI